jgi:hypothetical protein
MAELWGGFPLDLVEYFVNFGKGFEKGAHGIAKWGSDAPHSIHEVLVIDVAKHIGLLFAIHRIVFNSQKNGLMRPGQRYG